MGRVMSLAIFRQRLHEASYGENDKKWFPKWLARYTDGKTLNDGSADSCGMRGLTPKQFAALFNRLRISPEIRCRRVKEFGKLFSAVAGQPQRIDGHRSKSNSRRYRTRLETHELLAPS